MEVLIHIVQSEIALLHTKFVSGGCLYEGTK